MTHSHRAAEWIMVMDEARSDARMVTINKVHDCEVTGGRGSTAGLLPDECRAGNVCFSRRMALS